MSEANRDAAEQYIARAKRCLQQGDFSGAITAANKSNSLFPSSKAEAILKQAEGAASGTGAAATGSRATSTGTNETSARRRVREASEPPVDGRTATKAQIQIANSILEKSDLYDRLGVSRDADENTIRKAFRKLSVKVHPDRNPAPRANEAFKAINNACDVLCDTSKRRIYDQTGEENPNAARQQANPFAGFQGGHNGGVDPAAELLRQMFGGGFQAPGGAHFVFNGHQFNGAGFGNQRRRRQQQREGGGEEGMNLIFWVLTTMLALSFMWGDSGNEQVYSMRRQRDFVFEKYVPNPALGDDEKIKFYVKRNLADSWESIGVQRLRVQVEEQILKNYWTDTYRRCRRGDSLMCIRYEKYREWQHSSERKRRRRNG